MYEKRLVGYCALKDSQAKPFAKFRMLLNVVGLIFLINSALCGVAYGQTVDEALSYYTSGNYDKAFSIAMPLAERGDDAAQFGLGLMYYEGNGPKRDISKALRWLKMSADQSNSMALNLLCQIYGDGKDFPKDDQTAFQYCLKSADLGNADGQLEMGYRYAYGIGVKNDDHRAVEFYMKSAEQGNSGAQHNLGFMYFEGRGVAKSNSEAELWYRKAASQGNSVSMRAIGLMHFAGDIGFRDEVKALAWYILAKKNGLNWIQKDIDELSGKLTAEQISDAESLANKCIENQMTSCD